MLYAELLAERFALFSGEPEEGLPVLFLEMVYSHLQEAYRHANRYSFTYDLLKCSDNVRKSLLADLLVTL